MLSYPARRLIAFSAGYSDPLRERNAARLLSSLTITSPWQRHATNQTQVPVEPVLPRFPILGVPATTRPRASGLLQAKVTGEPASAILYFKSELRYSCSSIFLVDPTFALRSRLLSYVPNILLRIFLNLGIRQLIDDDEFI